MRALVHLQLNWNAWYLLEIKWCEHLNSLCNGWSCAKSSSCQEQLCVEGVRSHFHKWPWCRLQAHPYICNFQQLFIEDPPKTCFYNSQIFECSLLCLLWSRLHVLSAPFVSLFFFCHFVHSLNKTLLIVLSWINFEKHHLSFNVPSNKDFK